MPQDPEAARALSLAHGQICYLQIPAANRERAAAFYEAVFGWRNRAALHRLRVPRPHRPAGRRPPAGPAHRAR